MRPCLLDKLAQIPPSAVLQDDVNRLLRLVSMSMNRKMFSSLILRITSTSSLRLSLSFLDSVSRNRNLLHRHLHCPGLRARSRAKPSQRTLALTLLTKNPPSSDERVAISPFPLIDQQPPHRRSRLARRVSLRVAPRQPRRRRHPPLATPTPATSIDPRRTDSSLHTHAVGDIISPSSVAASTRRPSLVERTDQKIYHVVAQVGKKSKNETSNESNRIEPPNRRAPSDDDVRRRNDDRTTGTESHARSPRSSSRENDRSIPRPSPLPVARSSASRLEVPFKALKRRGFESRAPTVIGCRAIHRTIRDPRGMPLLGGTEIDKSKCDGR